MVVWWVTIILVSHIPCYFLLTYKLLLAHWASYMHQSLSFLLSCLHFYTGIGALECMHASFGSFMSLGSTGTSFSHHFSYHHTTAFIRISLVVFFISFSLFYLLFVLLHILSTLSGDPPQFIIWRTVTSFPLFVPWILIWRPLAWEGHIIGESLWYFDAWEHIHPLLTLSL